MSTQDFLVELGTEELPPKALKTLSQAFTDGIVAGLQAAGLAHGKVHSYAAPRRLAVMIEQLAVRQADREQTMDGPPVQAAFDADGNPTKAALGFARRCGVELDAIDRSGPKLRFVQQIAGQPTTGLLPGIVEQSLDKLPIPKRMRWGARREEFVRPTQWLVMLLGEQVVDCTILSQQAGRLSRGHRFHHNEDVSIARPSDYLDSLRAAKVLADFGERRNLIEQRVQELAKAEQGQAIMPSSLLDEVTSLVEWPVPLVCSFEEHFLQVPQEALIATMQDDQRYFCLVDDEGKLLPRFITVANLESKDPAQVVLVTKSDPSTPERCRVLLSAGPEAVLKASRTLKTWFSRLSWALCMKSRACIRASRTGASQVAVTPNTPPCRYLSKCDCYRHGWRVPGNAGYCRLLLCTATTSR